MPVNDFRDAMAEQGIVTDDPIVADGQRHRFRVKGDKQGDKNGFYILFPDGVPAGDFGTWKENGPGDWHKWSAKPERTLTDEERREYRRRIDLARRERQEEEAVRRAECRKRAADIWKNRSMPVSTHPYLEKKGVTGRALRVEKTLRAEGSPLLIPIRDTSGILHGLQRIFPDGSKRYMVGTDKSGHYHSIGTPKGEIFIAEGLATGLSIHEAIGGAVACALDCGNLEAVAVALRAKYPDMTIVVCGDNDEWTDGNPGVTKASEAAKAVGGLLVIPAFRNPEGRPSDFNDLHQREGLGEVRRQVESAAAPMSNSLADESPAEAKQDGQNQEQEPPLAFDEIDTPEIPPELLPGWLGEYAAAVALSTQTPPAMAAMMAISIVATCVAKRFEVAPYGEGYSEPLNCWIDIIMGPANRKTATVSALTAPLVEWESSEAERLAPEIKREATKRRILERRIEKLEKEAANSDEAERREVLLWEIGQLEKDMPEEVREPRLWTGDTTPERLQSLLVDNGERMAVLTDEGGIFEVMAGLYSGGRANLDIFLQGHAGQAVRVDRQGRTAHLDAPALSFGLATQPAILADFTSGGKKHFRGNGTLARFLYVIPRSNIGNRDVRANYQIPETVKARYRKGVFDLLAIPPQMIDGREKPRRLTLAPEALECWLAFAGMIEKRQGADGDLETILDWSGKLPGAALRIAGNFHLVEHGANPPAQIEAATIERALDLCTLLIDHAKAAFAMMEADPATADAKAILQWIVKGRLCRFKRGEAYRQFKGRFTGKTERLDKALRELQARAFVTEGTEQTGGRAATVFTVNSLLWEAA